MITERIEAGLTQLAEQLDTNPEALALELLSTYEVAIAEGNHVYGKRNLSRALAERAIARRQLQDRLNVIDATTKRLLHIMTTLQSVLSSSLVIARRKKGLPIATEPMSQRAQLGEAFGYFQTTGQIRNALPKPTEPKKTRKSWQGPRK